MKICIVGCGKQYHYHAKALVRQRNVKKLFFVDKDFDRAKYAAKEYPRGFGRKFGTEIPDGYEGYVVCVDVDAQYLVTHMCILEKPLFVAVEKPVGANLHEASRLVAMAEAYGVRIFTTYQRRFDPILLELSKRKTALIVDCHESFEWMCHFHDMSTWYEGPIIVNKKKEKCRTEIYATDQHGHFTNVDRCLDFSFDALYSGRTKNRCEGKQILIPHIINQYEDKFSDTWWHPNKA